MNEGTKGQILRTLKGKHLKNKEVVGFDIETSGSENYFYMGGLYSPAIIKENNGFKAFYDKEELIKHIFFLARKHRNLWFVATNLMFDFTEVFYNTKYWNKFSLVMKQGKLLLARYKDENKNYEISFIDTLNYGGLSVKVMGEILNKNKLATPKALGKIPQNEKEREELETYNRRDCEVTHDFMKFLQEGFKSFGGKTKLTTSATAMDIFRRKHLKKWIFKEDFILRRTQETSIHKFIFGSYFGGRTETFKRGYLGGKNLKVWDINSMYSAAMLQSMPKPDSVKHTLNPTKELLNLEGVSKVLVKAPDIYYPLLPKRLLDKNGTPTKLVFPKGVFMGNYTHVELRKAISLGYDIIKIYETLYYKETFKPFDTYVKDIYRKKKEYTKIKSPLKHITKLLLNGIYGKFAERTAEETKIIDPVELSREEYAEITKGTTPQLTRSGHIVINKIKPVYKPHVIPIFASYTTAHARLNLYDYLVKYKGLYCDTDSVFTLKSMPESAELGGMKLEYNVRNAILVKPKMYMFDIIGGETKIRLKGVTRPDREKFLNILKGKSVSFDKFTKLKEGVRRGIKPNSIQTVEKSINLEDDKRNWKEKFNPADFQNSEPLKMKE